MNTSPTNNLRKLFATGAILVISASLLGAYLLSTTVVPTPKMLLLDGRPTKVALGSISFSQILQQANRQNDPRTFIYGSPERTQHYRDELKQNMPLMDHLGLELRFGDELLNAGNTEEALGAYTDVETILKQTDPKLMSQMRSSFLLKKAICNLRIGEQQNCCANNNQDSCLVPIQGQGIHTKQNGSRNAIKYLTEVLTMDPKDLKARWLLNIAYMTVGEYPYAVPHQYLISPKAYGAEYAMKPFVNVARSVGLDMENCAGGVAMEDFDGDGFLDVMISSVRPDGHLRFFHNNGDGTFTERTKEAGLFGELGGLNMVTTDYNNDGNVDVLLLRGGWYGKQGHLPASLLRNNGNGAFTNVTLEAGLLRMHPTQTAVWFDYNGDGKLDVFIGDESTPDDPSPCELFRNNGDGTFTECSHEAGVDKVAFVKAVVSADYNKDGRPDLYLSCQGGRNMLLRNDGPAGTDKSATAPWKFTEVGHEAGVDKQMRTFSCFFFDYDNDGWPDLYVGGYGMKDVSDVAADYCGLPTNAERSRLYHNNHDGTFTDVTKQAHLYKVIQGMGVNFGDLDNDGYQDFYCGTGNPDFTTLIPNRMFRNAGGKFFQEVTTTGDFGHLQKGHGIAFGDINNDGNQDVLAEMGGAFAGDTAHDCLYANPGSKNHWVTLKLSGVQSNRAAIGAEITVRVATKGGDREIHRTIGSGGSFGCNPFRSEIGLGDAVSIKQVSIHWPTTGKTQIVSGVDMDHFYQIQEGAAQAALYTPKSFALPIAGRAVKIAQQPIVR